MKALFNCRPAPLDLNPVWQGSAYLQPICNRPLLEYWLDLCIWLGIQEVLMVLYPGEEALQQHLPRGEDWGLRMQTVEGDAEDVLPDILSRQALFLDQDLLVLDGPIFPFYDRRQLCPLPSQGQTMIYTLDQKALSLNDTVLLFPKAALDELLQARDEQERFQRWTSLPIDRHGQLNFAIVRPQNLQSHLQLNLLVLKEHARFHLKAFEVAPQIFEGLHNEIAQRPALGGPVLTGSYCQLGPGVLLENVILHDQVRIEGHSHLKNCMVWGPVFLGDLELENSLVFRDHLLDATSGQLRPLEQHFRLKQELESHQALQERLQADAQQATRLLLPRLPLYLLLRWFVPSEMERFYLNANGEILILPEYHLPELANSLQRFFFAHSLHRVPRLLAVREQRLLLVGTRLLPARPDFLTYIQNLPIYAPGAFSHTEQLEPDTLEHWMEELSFCSQADEDSKAAILAAALERDKQL